MEDMLNLMSRIKESVNENDFRLIGIANDPVFIEEVTE